MLEAQGVQNVQRKRRHKERRVRRCNVQHSHPGLSTDILRGDCLFLCRGGHHEQGAENLHGIDVMLPNVEAPRTKINGQCSMDGLFVVKVHRNRF